MRARVLAAPRRGSVGEARGYAARMLAQAALCRRAGLPLQDVRSWLACASLARQEAERRAAGWAGTN